MPSSDTQFKPGKSGNPNGRPARNDARDMARELTGASFAALIRALESPKERVAAATILLAYGWGKPTEKVESTNINVDAVIGIDAPPLPETLEAWLQRRRAELDTSVH